MADKIVLTRAGIKDASILAQLGEATFRDTFGAQNRKEDMDQYVAEVMSVEPVATELADANNHFFLAWYNGSLTGYAKMRANREPCVVSEKPVEIERLYVLHTFHGRKVGAALMAHCIGFAKRDGHDVVWLGVWEYNYKAVGFYEKWGFAVCGAHPFLLGTDLQTDMVMMKRLDA